MTIVLGENRYGKSRVRLMKVMRGASEHRIFEWNVEVWLEGDFRDCFLDGDNSRILPTDTMKNTVYSLARASLAVSMEDFAKELVDHFIENNKYAELAGVRIQATPWKHISAGGVRFPSTFTHGDGKKDTATVTRSRGSIGYTVKAGFEDLWLLKTARSAFAGFLKDHLTTLKETYDRLFGTLAKAEWEYSESDLNFNLLREATVTALLQAFGEHDSLSVQQTLYAMAQNVLESVENVREIHLFMPNKHCNLIDLSPFGQDNPNQLFVPTDEPHGSIEARVRRGD